MVTTDDTLLSSMLERLYEMPEDWTLRLVIADRFEELGDQSSADCMRWMSRNRKRAWTPKGESYYAWYKEAENWSGCDPNSDIPSALIDRMRSHHQRGPHTREWESREESETAIREAWGRAIEAGWIPEDC